RAASAIVTVAIAVMNGIEHQPEHIAFKLERPHGLALKLGRVAILERNRERLVRIALRLCGAATEIIEAVWVDKRIKFFECRESCRHQIGRKKLGEGGCNRNWLRLSTRDIEGG